MQIQDIWSFGKIMKLTHIIRLDWMLLYEVNLIILLKIGLMQNFESVYLDNNNCGHLF